MKSIDLETRANELLATLTGRPDAAFRPDQLEAIRTLVSDRQRVLLVQRTGWGKSAVYFIATKLLREAGGGPTLLVSPLLALMRNQLEAAERTGVRAATINSANTDEWQVVLDQLDDDQIDLLLISPERLANVGFRSEVLPAIGARSGLLVVDEAHCISDWGHDFRPDYRRIVRVLDLLPTGVPVLCCTATANDRVVADVEQQMATAGGLQVLRGALGRDGLSLHSLRLSSQPERLAWLSTTIPQLAGSGIVYCLTVRDAEQVAAWLRLEGIDAHAYHGGTDPPARPLLEQRLLDNELKVLVATSALGMGFDKPDLAFVIHFQAPGSPVAYYQQVGRAGRQLDCSVGVLLAGTEDREIQDWFITTAFPPREQAEAVVALLEAADEPTTLTAIEAEVNVKHSRLEAMLKVLEVDGAVEKVGRGWVRTARPWAHDTERAERVTAMRRDEQAQMVGYTDTEGCRMQFLRRLLDDPDPGPCGECDNCTDTRWAITVDHRLAARAKAFLRRRPITIEPRRQWPIGLGRPKGRLGERQLSEGRALCQFDDGGWGPLVGAGKYGDDHLDDALVTASAELIEQWSLVPEPSWVTCVPSLRHPTLVPSFASRLADQLGLPFVPAVHQVRDTAPQADMENSAQQVANRHGAFTIGADRPDGPVLLVDDTYSSRWTLTVVGAALRDAGVPAVFPFVLASMVGS